VTAGKACNMAVCTRPQSWNGDVHGEAPDGPLSCTSCALPFPRACALQLTTANILPACHGLLPSPLPLTLHSAQLSFLCCCFDYPKIIMC
jgi:hypothetical protein